VRKFAGYSHIDSGGVWCEVSGCCDGTRPHPPQKRQSIRIKKSFLTCISPGSGDDRHCPSLWPHLTCYGSSAIRMGLPKFSTSRHFPCTRYLLIRATTTLSTSSLGSSINLTRLANASLHAQSAPTISTPSSSLQSASVKLNRSGGPFFVQFPAGRFTATNTTTELLIELAYDVMGFQLSGAPGWMSSERYDIDAKIDDLSDESPTPTEQRELKRTPGLTLKEDSILFFWVNPVPRNRKLQSGA